MKFSFKTNIKNTDMVKTIANGIKYSCPTVSLNIAFDYFLYHPCELLLFEKFIEWSLKKGSGTYLFDHFY